MPKLGNSVKFKANMSDFEGAPLTPDTQAVTILDPADTVKLTEDTPTKEDDGLYSVTYLIPSDALTGIWQIVWSIARGTHVKTRTKTFRVTSS